MTVVSVESPWWFHCDIPGIHTRVTTSRPSSTVGPGSNSSQEQVSTKKDKPIILLTAKEGNNDHDGRHFWLRVGYSEWSERLELSPAFLSRVNSEVGNYRMRLPEVSKVYATASSSLAASTWRGSRQNLVQYQSGNPWYHFILQQRKVGGLYGETRVMSVKPLLEFVNALSDVTILVGEKKSIIPPVSVSIERGTVVAVHYCISIFLFQISPRAIV